MRRKVTLGGVSFVRIQKYTNETLPPLRNSSDFSLGLDILMMADYSTLQGFIEISGGDSATGEIYTLEYLRALFEQVKVIYDDISVSKRTIHLNMVGAFVALREDDCPMFYTLEGSDEELVYNSTFDNSTIGVGFEESNTTELTLTVAAVEALDRFNHWLRAHEQFLPKHDHAILITKYDLLSPRGESATQGMAYVGNICKPGDSSSIVEDIGAAATALIAAHELGHNLGAFHDGNPEAKDCLSSENFLMSSTVSGSEDYERFAHSRVMSPCSVKSIEVNLEKPSAQCIKKAVSVTKKQRAEAEMTRTPGEIIGLRQQCQIAFGPHYGVCPSREYLRGNDLCRRVWCKDRAQRRTEPCETKTYLPALDGTECGRTKIRHSCVLQLFMLIRPASDCVDLNEKTCRKYSKVKLRHYCKASDFKEICCRSCAQLKDL
ncbi:unnamed protein product [Heligmosomoides polygyrus]|uniref:Peptidase M12B domain-containing protein n=1 Tax=Heligmosomoides polygyrus TaxID=6339 RepID=A0A3P7YEH0_HELPZ|nr:unnamed protein product [Heligmosomoides polygyrus]